MESSATVGSTTGGSPTRETRGLASNSLDCVYRCDVQGSGAGETANCLLLAQIVSTSPQNCSVTRPMCEACIAQTRDQAFSHHPVFPSVVYQISTQQLASNLDPATESHWQTWLDRAEAACLQQSRPTRTTLIPNCDVILCAASDGPQLRSAIQSILEQVDAIPILHLIDTDPEPIDFGRLASRWNVLIHRMSGPVTTLSALTRVSSSLRTPYVAVQNSEEISDPLRLHRSIDALRETGAELFVARVLEDEPPEQAAEAPDDGQQTLIPSSLVIRRATLIDLGASETGQLESETGLITRACGEGRSMATSADLAVSRPPALGVSSTLRVKTNVAAPSPLSLIHSRRPHFASPPVRCDVVLPFRGQLNYVREALDGLLRQEQATPIIHLIDDATEADTTDFLNHWAAHPQLRVYRNRENIGQFQSFNNVSPFWETDLVAVQDADDISLPHRLQWAAQMLSDSGADYFGGAVELFGDEELIRPTMHESTELERIRRADYRRSYYPQWAKTDYFLENPTAVFRVAMFRELGGYADFGSRLMNRTSLDTEFQLRCLFRGVRFAITREVVTRYRVHPESATQDRLTGWGTTPRSESIRQLEERCRLFRSGDFDPRSFGALGRYTGVTVRWVRS